MIMNRKYSVRLASGVERSFDNAAALAQWMEQQRQIEYPIGHRRSRPARKRQARKPDAVVKATGAPLARYARQVAQDRASVN